MNLNEQLKSVLGSQIMTINIYTSLAKSQVNFFITKSNARLDFSFPLISTYISPIWLEITFVWSLTHFCFLYIHTHKHTYTHIHVLMCTIHVHVYTHIHIHGKKPQYKDDQVKIFYIGWEKNVSLVLSISLPNFIAL